MISGGKSSETHQLPLKDHLHIVTIITKISSLFWASICDHGNIGLGSSLEERCWSGSGLLGLEQRSPKNHHYGLGSGLEQRSPRWLPHKIVIGDPLWANSQFQRWKISIFIFKYYIFWIQNAILGQIFGHCAPLSKSNILKILIVNQTILGRF